MAKKNKQPVSQPVPEPTVAGEVLSVPVELILPNPQQPRVEFDPGELAELAESIREHGVIQPLVAERSADGKHFILHAGERRLRASKLAGLAAVPVILGPQLNGAGAMERLLRALVENIQRANMNPIEEARAYQQLEEMGLSANEIALKLGVSYNRVVSRLKLLKLDAPIQDLIATGRLTKDARIVDALQDIPDTEARVEMAKTLAERSATIKASIEACQRLVGRLAEQKIPRTEVPALRIATRKAGEVRRSVWDAFAAVGKVPPWPLMEVCVRDTCDNCAMRDMASATTCKGCALIELLRQMIGATK